MVLPKTVLALAAAAPALGCVQYHSDYNWGTGRFSAALTDNGQQKCQLKNHLVGLLTADNIVVELSCIAGYRATFNFQTESVWYTYPGFEGTFGTLSQIWADGNGFDNFANTWGC